jgi:hypothetical protein
VAGDRVSGADSLKAGAFQPTASSSGSVLRPVAPLNLSMRPELCPALCIQKKVVPQRFHRIDHSRLARQYEMNYPEASRAEDAVDLVVEPEHIAGLKLDWCYWLPRRQPLWPPLA